jgi:hypothetical protein
MAQALASLRLKRSGFTSFDTEPKTDADAPLDARAQVWLAGRTLPPCFLSPFVGRYSLIREPSCRPLYGTSSCGCSAPVAAL